VKLLILVALSEVEGHFTGSLHNCHKMKTQRYPHPELFTAPAVVEGYPHPELVEGHPHPELVEGHPHPELVEGYPHPELVEGHPHPELVEGYPHLLLNLLSFKAVYNVRSIKSNQAATKTMFCKTSPH
jgi:hypothetical protein